MKRISKYILGIGLILMLSQCFKEEEPIELPEFGTSSKVETIEMGPEYAGQYFYDLGSGQVVTSNHKTAWDLAFECDDQRFFIWSNSSKTMKVAKAPTKDFDRSVDVSALDWTLDGSKGSTDSNAIGIWGDFGAVEPVSNKDVYIFDRGEDELGKHLGYRKFQLLQFVDNAYEFQYANLDGKNHRTVSILKDNLFNFRYFSFNDAGTLVDIAPFKVDWDIVFTRYTTLFYAPDLLPYQVTGGLINPEQVEVAVVQDNAFYDISFDIIDTLTFSTEWDAVGYNWKSVDINSGLFSINIDQTYIIKDVAGDYYKLRFVDFYNDFGEKGYPKFEYQKL